MKRTLIIIFFCQILQVLIVQAQNTNIAKKIFNESLNASMNLSACSYEATWKIVGLGAKDTIINIGQIQIALNSKNTIGIDSFYCLYSSKRISYNGRTLVSIDTADNSIQKATEMQRIQQQLSNMPLSLFVLLYVNADYSPTGYMTDEPDSKSTITIDTNELVGRERCYKITIEYPEDEAIFSRREEYYISTTSKLLYRFTSKTSHRNYGGAHQYYSIEINHLKIEPLQFNYQYNKDIILDERASKTTISNIASSLTIGQQLPTITVRTLDKQVIDFKKNKDTLYLLYSWFIGCAGCEQSRPMMKEFYEKYALKHPFKIIGLNIANNDGKLIQRYLEQKEIRYPNAMLNQKDKKLLQLEAPTFIIVKNNTILFYQMGYAPVIKEMLEHTILPNL